MNIVAISDTHARHNSVVVPYGDVVIHAGDITTLGSKNQVSNFLYWFSRLPHKHKIFVGGNHDWLLANNKYISSTLIPSNITYLHNSTITINGIKIYGSPNTPIMYGQSFELRDDQLQEIWNTIPDDTDILVTHTPPNNILDKNPKGSHGCKLLAKRLENTKVKYHIFGRIHEGYGLTTVGGCTYINASSCDGNYSPVNKPVTFELASALQY